MGTRKTDLFDILTGVRQGCLQSSLFFLLAVDFVLKQATYPVEEYYGNNRQN
uniref:Reverse transcriptase domain-containing protein n=1 Tax=Octopus bimaculoides TaxID=37653 RepID=A0A0L8GWH0_OCTBM